MMRFEVWFNNGLFRAFPNVKTETVRNTDGFLIFEFGKSGTHRASINLNNVNFMEKMPED